MKRIALRLVLALVLVAAVAAALAWHHYRGTSSLAASPASLPPPLTGVYADDWQASCGKETGAAQESCTARLNTRYGRAEDVPVPK